MGRVDWGFDGVGFVECFDLADRGWAPYASEDVFDGVSSAELRELSEYRALAEVYGRSVKAFFGETQSDHRPDKVDHRRLEKSGAVKSTRSVGRATMYQLARQN